MTTARQRAYQNFFASRRRSGLSVQAIGAEWRATHGVSSRTGGKVRRRMGKGAVGDVLGSILGKILPF